MTAPACQVCSEPLDGMWDGLHPTCQAPPEPMLPALYEMLARHQGGSARSMQVKIGPSEIGDECERKLAYKVFGLPAIRVERLKWAAQVGTWGHVGLAGVFAEENKRLGRERYLIERRVPVAPELGIDGSCDLYDMDTAEVVDHKFPGKTSLDTYRRDGPSQVYRVQTHLYGRGFANLGFPVRSVRILFLPRASHLFDDAYEWSEPYSRDIADAALARLQHIVLDGVQLGLGEAAADFGRVPASTDSCRFCPWHQPLAKTATKDGCPGEGPSKSTTAVFDGII